MVFRNGIFMANDLSFQTHGSACYSAGDSNRLPVPLTVMATVMAGGLPEDSAVVLHYTLHA